MTFEDVRLASVDVRQVLAESLAPYGFSLGESHRGFVRLFRQDLPRVCAVFFLLSNSTAIYAIRALVTEPVVIVLHVNDRVVDDEENLLLHPLGIHAARLRTVASLDSSAIEVLTGRIRGTLSVVGSASGEERPQLQPDRIEACRDALSQANPDHVVEYASQRKETLFEQATAKVLLPMFGWVCPLGSSFSGRLVPDGVVVTDVQRGDGPRPEIASYDCKSRAENSYKFDAGDGDQQQRYLDIQRRLEIEHQWRGRGLLIFTPDVEPADLDDKVQKDAWGRIVDSGRTLIVVPARVLRRWWQLQQQEEEWRRFSLIGRPHIWSALFDGLLPGVSEAVAAKLMPGGSRRVRLLNEESAELIWLAGLHNFSSASLRVAESLQAADPESLIQSKIKFSRLIQLYVAALAKKSASIESICTATGLGVRGVSYLIQSRTLGSQIGIAGAGYASINLENFGKSLA